MANMKHFADFGGRTVHLTVLDTIDTKEFTARFPGVVGKRFDSFTKRVGFETDRNGEMLPVTRVIEFKKNPSLHQCSAKCLNATGFQCECSCGGKNHGGGNFRCN